MAANSSSENGSVSSILDMTSRTIFASDCKLKTTDFYNSILISCTGAMPISRFPPSGFGIVVQCNTSNICNKNEITASFSQNF